MRFPTERFAEFELGVLPLREEIAGAATGKFRLATQGYAHMVLRRISKRICAAVARDTRSCQMQIPKRIRILEDLVLAGLRIVAAEVCGSRTDSRCVGKAS